MSSRAWSITSLLGIVVIAVMRCVVVFAPQVYFDVDPALDPTPLAGMGMPASLMLDVLLLLFCAIGFIGIAKSGRFQWPLALLAVVPLPVIVYHGWSDVGDLWRGATWFAAVVAGVIVAHLTRDRMVRIIVAALLLAVIAPLLLRGAAQMTFEHADTLTAYEQHREQFLQDRGWEPQSPAAQIYERRLAQPQPIGWFFTTNIYAAVMVASALALVGLTLAAYRAKLPSGWSGLTGALALSCMAMVYLSGSKGAALALLAGLTVCVLPLALTGCRAIFTRFGSTALLALIAIALLGIILRGTVLPESFLGEKSLLFRWHYLVSASGMFANHLWTGVGPDGFQATYMQFRLPRNPEEVISAHSVFIDWMATIGVLGAAWVALVVVLLWRAGSTLRHTGKLLDDADRDATMSMGIRAACVVAALAVGIGIAAEAHVLGALDLSIRVLGLILYAALATVLMWLFARVEAPPVNWSLAAAAAALVMHGQIEMTFFLHSSIVWAMCMVGLAAGGFANAATVRGTTEPTHSTVTCYVSSGLMAAVAIYVLWTAAVPAMSQQRALRDAVDALHPAATTRDAMAEQRMRAAGVLVAAYEVLPTNPMPLQAAVRQYELAVMLVSTEQRTAVLNQAIAIADRLVADHPGHDTFTTRAALHATAAAMGFGDHWHNAIDDARAAVKHDPHGNMTLLMLADLLWLAGDRDASVEAYQRALAADANFELDVLKQMPERRRALAMQRIAEVKGE